MTDSRGRPLRPREEDRASGPVPAKHSGRRPGGSPRAGQAVQLGRAGRRRRSLSGSARGSARQTWHTPSGRKHRVSKQGAFLGGLGDTAVISSPSFIAIFSTRAVTVSATRYSSRPNHSGGPRRSSTSQILHRDRRQQVPSSRRGDVIIGVTEVFLCARLWNACKN